MEARDLVNKKFGKLTVTSFGYRDKHGKLYWYCRCDCGTERHPAQGSNLVSGKVWHCGCEKRGAGITNLKNLPPTPVVGLRGLSLDDIALSKKKKSEESRPMEKIQPVPLPGNVDDVHLHWKLHRRPSKATKKKVAKSS